MSKSFMDKRPIMALPNLAVKIGLKEAIILQQIHYWLNTSSHEMNGQKWVCNSYKEWKKQMPYWSENTIKRTIQSLESQGYLISANWNRMKMDKTKWYTIDYEKVKELKETGVHSEVQESFSEPQTEENAVLQEQLELFLEQIEEEQLPQE
ncbi:hypothetical protein [Neobacillus mesonae]|uniref:Replication protein n=1 Tax=Neobacillus mesonae TaxID=1193713 RepID=A0A3Q9QT06_9BACI|nr:hypothetical protein [Neobacillus mesonae]AZU62600.1 hypothetical protein CHR53_15740 [Neobacillus mesonae]